MFALEEIFKQLRVYLINKQLKHELHEFSSGCKLVDIWHNGEFYVVQIENTFIGYSLVDSETDSFSTIPDFMFNGFESFKVHFENSLR